MNKKKLLEKLKNREYREAFVSDLIDMGISAQIKAMREQRGWKQQDLGERAGMKQTAISRLENPDYEKLTTLKRLANAFDVGLLVRFVTFRDLVKWNFTPDTFEIPSFDEDTYFLPEGGHSLFGGTTDKQPYEHIGSNAGNIFMANANGIKTVNKQIATEELLKRKEDLRRLWEAKTKSSKVRL